MKQFFTSIKQGVVSPVYLFYGEQELLMDEAVAALRALVAPDGNTWNVDEFDGAKISPAEAISAAATAPFFAERRLIVVRDVPWFGAKGNDEELALLTEYLAAPVIGNILVLTVRGAVDKRRKVVKTIQKAGRVIECAGLGHSELILWLKRRFQQQGFTIGASALEYLTMLAGDNLAYLANEVDKICLYADGQSEVELADVEAVASRGSVLEIFKLIDAVAERQGERSLLLYRELIRQGEAEQKILSMLGKQFRDILAVDELLKQGLTQPQIAQKLSVHPFVVRKCAGRAHKFSRAQLIRALELLLAADIANKNGQGDLRSLLQLAILQICA